MNRLVTFTLMPLITGLMVVFFTLGSIVREPPRAWLWWVLVPTAFAVVLSIAVLLNFGIFAPVYWLLGRWNAKKQQKQNGRT